MRVRTCPNCGQNNRVPPEHLASTGRCGACKAQLPPLNEPLEVGPSEFDAIVENAKVPVLVDFWADWCGPCRMVGPEVKKAAHNLAGSAIVLKVDTQRHPELAQRFNVQGIPNFLVLKGRRPIHQQPGAVGHQQLEQWVQMASA